MSPPPEEGLLTLEFPVNGLASPAELAMLGDAVRRLPGVQDAFVDPFSRRMRVAATEAGRENVETQFHDLLATSPHDKLYLFGPLVLLISLPVLSYLPGLVALALLLPVLLLLAMQVLVRAWRHRTAVSAPPVLLALLGLAGGTIEAFHGAFPGAAWAGALALTMNVQTGLAFRGFAKEAHAQPLFPPAQLQRSALEALRILPYAVMLLAIVTVVAWTLFGANAEVTPPQAASKTLLAPAPSSGLRAGLLSGMAVILVAAPGFWAMFTWPVLYRAQTHLALRGFGLRLAGTLEALWLTRICAFGRRGVMTQDKPILEEALGADEKILLAYAVFAEAQSDHPLAQLIRRKAPASAPPELKEWREAPDRGVVARFEQEQWAVGNELWFQALNLDYSAWSHDLYRIAREGRSALLVARNEQVLGVLKVLDPLRPESVRTVKRLKKMGVRSYLLTGEPAQNAQIYSEQLGVEGLQPGVIQEKLPDVLHRLRRETIGRVAAVLRPEEASESIELAVAVGEGAMGTATSVAKLEDLPELFATAHKTRNQLYGLAAAGFLCLVVLIPIAMFGQVHPYIALPMGVGLEWLPVLLTNFIFPLRNNQITSQGE